MALKRNERYPGRFNNPSAAHPQGAFQNRSSPNAQDGSYIEADWANDWSGFFERLLTVANYTANGNVDTATSSQYFDALVESVKRNLGTAAQYNVGTGTSQLPDMSAFTALKSSAGYQKLPGGIIMQWGLLTGSTGQLAATYPIVFPNAVFQVTAVLADKTAGATGGISLYNEAGGSSTRTTLIVQPRGSDGMGTTTARFIAIGW